MGRNIFEIAFEMVQETINVYRIRITLFDISIVVMFISNIVVYNCGIDIMVSVETYA